MADGTHISWTDATWSPVTGCTKISDGCLNCYIDRTPPFRMQHRRFNGPDIGATTGVQLHPERLPVPLRWRKPRRIFVCSLADLFHDDVPDTFIASVFAIIAAAPQHTFQILTKRHGRMRSLLNSELFRQRVMGAATDLGYLPYPRHMDGAGRAQIDWPLPNCWPGVSTEDQKHADLRIPALLNTPAAVRWISAEPLLGPIDLTAWTTWRDGSLRYAEPDAGITGLNWVVAGGESGPGARPMHPDWPRSMRDQCQSAGIAFHFKQWGNWAPDGDAPYVPGQAPNNHSMVWYASKKAAGRELDGRTWDEYPTGGDR